MFNVLEAYKIFRETWSSKYITKNRIYKDYNLLPLCCPFWYETSPKILIFNSKLFKLKVIDNFGSKGLWTMPLSN